MRSICLKGSCSLYKLKLPLRHGYAVTPPLTRGGKTQSQRDFSQKGNVYG